MIYVLGIFFLLLGFLLICTILLQEGKGGGLAAMGGAVTDSVMGAKNPLRRMTVYFFICFIAVILALNYFINQENSGQITPGILPAGVPAAPAAPAAKTGIAIPALPASGAVLPAGSVPAAPAAPAGKSDTTTPAAAPAAAPVTPATPAKPAN